MTATSFALGANGAVFTLLGLAFLAAPERLLRAVDVTAASRVGRTELAAMYGGLELGFGAACLYGQGSCCFSDRAGPSDAVRGQGRVPRTGRSVLVARD